MIMASPADPGISSQLRMEQKHAISFCVKLHKSPKETIDMLEGAFGNNMMAERTVRHWHKLFIDGRISPENEKRTGRPRETTHKTVQLISDIVAEDHRVTVREVAEHVHIAVGTTYNIMKNELHMSHVCARWVSRLLTDEQRERRVHAAQTFLDRYHRQGHNFLERIVTVDETWVHYYDPETKRQSSVWKTPGMKTPVKAKSCKTIGKRMCVVFLDIRGIILVHMVPQGQTINGSYYSKVSCIIITSYVHKY